MRIQIIGGGPAGLHFGILMKRQDPRHDVCIFERSPRNATWGFGVVFSDRALEFLRRDDPETHDLLVEQMEAWPNLTIAHRDSEVPITGNGFAAIGRLELLRRLQEEAERCGVTLKFGSEIKSIDELGQADLVVAADGAASLIRDERAEQFGTTIDWRTNRFAWFGTTKAFPNLTLTFRQTDVGTFCAHHYRYAPDRSTFLVEVDEATFQQAGFEAMDEAKSIEVSERVFARELDGHKLLSNRSIWRTFPVVHNKRSSSGNVVLLGDALRTVHFSIGSGTRLAMEDALALAFAFQETDTVPGALVRFEETRRPTIDKLTAAANASLRWYEQMAHHMALSPIELAYSYMLRSGRIDHEALRALDPALVDAYDGSRLVAPNSPA